MSVLGIVGGPMGGAAADLIGRKPAVIVGGTTCALAFGALPFLESSWPASVGCMAAVGFGESFLMSATAALANDVTPAHLRGQQTAMLNQVTPLAPRHCTSLSSVGEVDQGRAAASPVDFPDFPDRWATAHSW
jgi:MFS family permease